MNTTEYMQLAQRTSNTKTDIDKILNGAMGLNGEAGEVIDIVKKHLFQGHSLDVPNILDECSDIMWYVAELLTGIGYTMDECMNHNINKLKKRFPNGFEAERSINRKG
jgi:NTP pyrophosphatase (non-canonical NTP hydrolase)